MKNVGVIIRNSVENPRNFPVFPFFLSDYETERRKRARSLTDFLYVNQKVRVYHHLFIISPLLSIKVNGEYNERKIPNLQSNPKSQ